TSDRCLLTSAEAAEQENSDCRPDEIRQELRLIIGSAGFRDSARLSRFITFVVERTLAGKGGTIKGYTIAVEALGRGSNFDPQSDPIVRVEAGRLRRALARYYESGGYNDPLVIDVPRGTYVPSFRRRGSGKFRPTALDRNSLAEI